MQNISVQFISTGVLLSFETYENLRRFCLMHGETDLPAKPSEAHVLDLSEKETPSSSVFSPKEFINRIE